MAVKVSYEIATNDPSKSFAVGRGDDRRHFWLRELTFRERQQATTDENELAHIAKALTFLKVEGEDVTLDWVMDHLGRQSAGEVYQLVFGGEDALKGLRAKPSE